ncbi:MAG: ABC transporter permease [Nitrososphaerota archaeon]
MGPEVFWLIAASAVGVLAILGVAARRDRHLAHISQRYVQRRPARAILIIFGLLLSTALIVIATIVSDTLTLAVQREAVAQVGRIDEEISSDTGGELRLFPESVAAQVRADLNGSRQVSGVAAALLVNQTLTVDATTKQTHSAINLLGMSATGNAGPLGAWRLQDGAIARVQDLVAGQVYINQSAANLLQAAAGDRLSVYSVHWSGQRVSARVRGIIDAGPLGSRPTIILPLAALQPIARAETQINRVYIANTGDGLTGVEFSHDVANRVRARLPAGLAVHLVKMNAVRLAIQAKTLFDTILRLYTLFALAVEALLIFLVFTLLAVERRSELATLRTLGLQRGAVVEMLLFEAAFYTLVAAAPGAALGLGLAYLLVKVITPSAAHLGISLQLGFDPATVFASLGACMLFSLLVTIVAAWLATGQTIATALRGTEDMLSRSTSVPAEMRYAEASRTSLRTIWNWATLAWDISWRWLLPIAVGIMILFAPWKRAGIVLAAEAVALCVGIAMLARWLYLRHRTAIIQTLPEESRLLALSRTRRAAGRVSALAIGTFILVYWALPPSWLGNANRFSGGMSTFFVAGMLMVLGAVLAVTPNLGLLLRPLQQGLAHFGRKRHVTTVALLYLASQRFRTGLSVALFGLVCFVMVVMACIATSTTQRYADVGALTGGYDIVGQPLSHPLTGTSELRTKLQVHAPAAAAEIRQISVASSLPLAVIQPSGANAGWRLYPAAQIDGDFLQGSGLPLAARAKGYATDAAVWRAVASQPGYVVIDAGALDANDAAALGVQIPPPPDLTDFAAPPIAATLLGPTTVAATLSQAATQALLRQATPEVRNLLDDPAKLHHFTLQLTNTGAQNGSFAPIPLWVGDFRSATPVRQVKVIGIVNNVQGQRYGLLGSPATFAPVETGLPVVSASYYYFRLTASANAADVAREIGAALIDNGFETTVVRATLLSQNAAAIFASELLLRLVAVMLLVGIVALMITGLRAVVERRQQIGVLRALGFQRGDVLLIFVIETLLVATGGAAAGLAIGLVLSHNAFALTFLDEAHLGLTLVVPWDTLALILLSAIICALAAVTLPARQASRIAPAEALRYE